MRKIRIITTLILLSSIPTWADDTRVLPNLGLKLQSLDYYDLSGGVVLERKPLALSSTISVNHLRAGTDISEIIFLGDYLSNATTFFLRQRFMYFWSEKAVGNIHEIRGPVVSNEIGVGRSGSSPVLAVFLGYAVALNQEDNVLYAGVGVNF